MLLQLLSTIFIEHAWAGGWVSSGGNVVVCAGAAPNEIESVELFDFFEGRTLYGWSPLRSTKDEFQQAADLAAKLDRNSSSGLFSAALSQVEAKLHFLPGDAELIRVDDSGSMVNPSGNCRIVQVALYRNDDQVFFARKLWMRMSRTDRAGLLVHEAVYAVLRRTGEVNSIRTRRIVSALFSHQPLLPVRVHANEVSTREELCSSKFVDQESDSVPLTAFFLRADTNREWTAEFTWLNGRMLVDQTLFHFTSTGTWPFSERQSEAASAGADGGSGKTSSLVESDVRISLFALPADPKKPITLWINDPLDRKSRTVHLFCQIHDVRTIP